MEVEYRGPISKAEFDRLTIFLSKEGVLKEKKVRRFVDYTDGIENRTKDIRVRETNGIPEIVIKLGRWGSEESREEVSVKCETGKFEDLKRIFALLGYDKGIYCERNITAYEFDGIEFALVEVPNHSYYFEAEILTTLEDADTAKEKIKKICADLGLQIFSENEFFKYIDILNKEANSVFQY